MSSVGLAGAASQHTAPLSRLRTELAAEVSSGAISGSDQSALSSALTEIDAALKSEASPGGARPTPDAIKSKIDSLIAGEVKDGKLTAAQADELKAVFTKAAQGAEGGGGAKGPGGARGGGGGGGGASQTSSDPADTNGDGIVSAAEQAAYDAKFPAEAKANDGSAASSSGAADDTEPSKLVSDFLKLVQDSLGNSAAYSANGQNLAAPIESQIVNYLA